MLFRRLYHDRLAQAAYLIGCQRTREAIVVDPLRDPAPYLDAARQEGVRIVLVAETHVHADFLSGAAALAAAANAELLLSGAGSGSAGYDRAAFATARWLRDGDRLELGDVRLDVLHVPGHTPEHLAFLVTDRAAGDTPMGLVSGDFLFVGDVGRPDLLERAAGIQGSMAESARSLFASLRRAATLPDHLQLWPAHGAGSACGKSLGAVPQSTIGYERRTNWALAVQQEDEFVERVLAGQPEPPPYFARMKRLNAGGAPPLPACPVATIAELRDAVRRGALVVDVRTSTEFAAGHLPRSLNLPLGSSFLAWAGSVLPADRDLVLVAGGERTDHGQLERAAHDLALIGFDRVIGATSLDTLMQLGDAPLATMRTVRAESLGASAPHEVILLDVRTRVEWDAGHVPGARHVPLPELAARVDELRDGRPVLVHCQGGSRSTVAASVLGAAGIGDVADVTGGYSAWARAGNRPATSE
jgi:hydroxyacylglutathione hydrolase